MLTIGVWIIVLLLALLVLGKELFFGILYMVAFVAAFVFAVGVCILGAILIREHYGSEALGAAILLVCAVGFYRTKVAGDGG